MKIAGIIPARYASTRFPGKPLADIAGKSMIRRVYEQASKVLSDVVVATDDPRIKEHVEDFGQVVFTDANHQSGTDRCAEALTLLDNSYDYVINIQGDEPFLDISDIQKIIDLLSSGQGTIEIATLATVLKDQERFQDPNVVKVVLNARMEAMYFSRSPIPHPRNRKGVDNYQHIGLYAYRSDILSTISKLPPSPLEQTESLEQLRWLEANYKISVVLAESQSIGIDTPEDLKKALESKLWQTS